MVDKEIITSEEIINIEDIYVDYVWDLPLDKLVDQYMIGENKKICEEYIDFKTSKLLYFDKNYAIYEASLNFP